MKMGCEQVGDDTLCSPRVFFPRPVLVDFPLIASMIFKRFSTCITASASADATPAPWSAAIACSTIECGISFPRNESRILPALDFFFFLCLDEDACGAFGESSMCPECSASDAEEWSSRSLLCVVSMISCTGGDILSNEMQRSRSSFVYLSSGYDTATIHSREHLSNSPPPSLLDSLSEAGIFNGIVNITLRH